MDEDIKIVYLQISSSLSFDFESIKSMKGKNFADVRQIYNSVILAATNLQKALKDSLLGKVYADKGKVAGVETDDREMKQKDL